MNLTSSNGSGAALAIKGTRLADGGPFGSSYTRWRQWQHDGNDGPTPHTFYRWKKWCDEYPVLRIQGIQDHILSFSALVDEKTSVLARSGVKLDQLLLLRCAHNHDLPEPHLQRDVMATKKTDKDDLIEYEKYTDLMRDGDPGRWDELELVYLLQLARKNPECFPKEARSKMARLMETRRNEAWLFPGLEILDYLYYAYEGSYERGVKVMLPCVSTRYVQVLDRIAEGFPPFGEHIWTSAVRAFIVNEAASYHGGTVNPPPSQPLLFDWED